MQKQINSWRKELSVIAETGTGSDNGILNKPKELEGIKKGNPV